MVNQKICLMHWFNGQNSADKTVSENSVDKPAILSSNLLLNRDLSFFQPKKMLNFKQQTNS